MNIDSHRLGRFPSLLAVLFLLITPRASLAVPSLQLDILGGFYDTTTETIVSTDSSFTLYALLSPDDKALLTDIYYISAAVIPEIGPELSNLGSFVFDGTSVNVTSDMQFGTPPVDAYDQLKDPGDLSKHGIFDTYFYQHPFTIDSNDKALTYNSQDNPGLGPTPDPNGPMYFAEFTVDLALLAPGYGIHFDLYNTTTGKKVSSDTDVLSFAPFSHDAEGCCAEVPEPGTLLLLGSGLVGLLGGRKYLVRK